jgi:cysteine synthase B
MTADGTPPAEALADLAATIGRTPLVELHSITPHPGVRMYAKLESANPTGSVKDRIALAMLSEALASGALQPGQTILEPSSGNTGISLAMLAARLGIPVRIVMPDNTTPERTQLLLLFGADIVFSPGIEGSNGAIRLAERLTAEDPELFIPFQYANPANPGAHERTTGPEILEALPGVDVFVAGLGTGGTLTGVGRALKARRTDIAVIAAEPLPGEQVSGLRSLEEGFVPPVLDASVLDDRYLVTNRDAVEFVRRLAREEGIFAGVSSGAAAAVATRVAATMDHGTIVVLLADGGWKYLSVGLWDRDLDTLEEEMEREVLW